MAEQDGKDKKGVSSFFQNLIADSQKMGQMKPEDAAEWFKSLQESHGLGVSEEDLAEKISKAEEQQNREEDKGSDKKSTGPFE